MTPGRSPDLRPDAEVSAAAAHRSLEVYLNDHLAGSILAAQVAQRGAREHSGSELGRFLAELARDIREDRDSLLRIMARLGIARHLARLLVAWITAKASWVKLSAPVLGRSRVGPLEEIETLTIGITGKRLLWRALAESAAGEAIGQAWLAELVERAERQLEATERHRLEAARRLFARAAPGAP